MKSDLSRPQLAFEPAKPHNQRMGMRFEVGRCQGCSETETLTNGYCQRCAVREAMHSAARCRTCGHFMRLDDLAMGYRTCDRRRCRGLH